VYDGLCPDMVLFSGNSLSNKKLYLLCDCGHYNVITKIKAAMTKGTYLKACDTCDKTIVIKLPSYVQQRHPVLKIGESIVLHTTDVPE